MGRHWFVGRDADTRFDHGDIMARPMQGEERWVVWEWDQRCCLDVYIPIPEYSTPSTRETSRLVTGALPSVPFGSVSGYS